jgi:hypothetical protein
MAVKGMLAARGQICLMVDADGATKFSDLDTLEARLMKSEENGYGIAIGSRAHLVSTDAVVQVRTNFYSLYCYMDRQSGHTIYFQCLITIAICSDLSYETF